MPQSISSASVISMPTDHHKVIDAIINCRSDHYGADLSMQQMRQELMWFIDPAAIGIAPIASTIKPESGFKRRWIGNYRAIIS